MTTAINGEIIVATGPFEYGGCSLVVQSVSDNKERDAVLPQLKVLFRVLHTSGNIPVLYEALFDAMYILDVLPSDKREHLARKIKSRRDTKNSAFTDTVVLDVDFSLLYPELEKDGALAAFEDKVRRAQIDDDFVLAAG